MRLFLLLIFVAISIYNEVSKARKKARHEAERKRQGRHATGGNTLEDDEFDPWDDIVDEVLWENNKLEDLEKDRERLRRERDEILARKARKRKMSNGAER